MTSEDKQIDLLLRQRSRRPTNAVPSDHLDPDAMSSFAEGGLPPAARAHYVSHLAQCDECRWQVSHLAIASGAVVRAEAAVKQEPEVRGAWQSFVDASGVNILKER